MMLFKLLAIQIPRYPRIVAIFHHATQISCYSINVCSPIVKGDYPVLQGIKESNLMFPRHQSTAVDVVDLVV